MRLLDELLPAPIAAQQRAWERNRRVLVLRRSGMTLRAIGVEMGFGPERARQMEAKAKRFEHSSPAARHLADNKNVAASLTPTERRRLAPIIDALVNLNRT